MRHVVVGSTHYSMFILKAIREADPEGIIYTLERSPEVAEIMARQVSGKPVHGLLTEAATLENAGIKIADTLFALTDSDALNANLAESAKKTYSVPLVVAIANNPKNAEILRKSGADYVLSPVDCATAEVRMLLSLDRPTVYSPPSNTGMDFIVLRPVNYLKFLDSILGSAAEAGDVKDIIVSSPRGGAIKKVEEIAKGDFLVIAVRKSSSERALRAVQEVIRKASRRKEQ